MSKIIEWLSHWDKDKILHDDLTFTISLLAACVCRLLVSKEWYKITACAFFAGFIAGVAKEIYDEWKYKGADERDWAADICGLVRGTLFSLLLTI
jgi:VanZ family protein